MLKLYVDAMNRLNHSARTISDRFSSREDEAGFAAAEQIALAVAGVLIVGLVFTFFRDTIVGGNGKTGFLEKITTTFTDVIK